MRETLAQVLVDLSIFLEFTDDESLDPDAAVGLGELVGARLSRLNDADKAALAASIRAIVEVAHQDFVAGLPETYGLTD